MFNIDKEKCTGCGLCIKDCFVSDIRMINGKAKMLNRRCFKCGHCIGICPVGAVSTDEYNMSEVKEYCEETFKVESENLLNFMKFRRTVRHFTDKKVEMEKLEKILASGRFSATGSNSQNVSYTVVTEKLDIVKKLSLESLKNLGEKYLQAENSHLVNETYKGYAKLWIKMYEDSIKNPESRDMLMFDAPVVIFIKSPSQVNGSIAACSMEYMVNSLGLGALYSGFLSLVANKTPKLQELLEVKEGEEVVIALVIGYPDIKYLRTVPRKELQVKWL